MKLFSNFRYVKYLLTFVAAIIAVASLADTACIILSEGVELDREVKALAESKGVNVLGTDKPIYETAATLSSLL